MHKIHAKFFILILFFLVFFGSIKTAQASTYQAERIDQNYAGILELNPGESFTFWVKFKNLGPDPWNGTGSEYVFLRTVSGMRSKLRHTSWYSDYIPNRVNPVSTIYPNGEALFRFTLLAPQENDTYWEKFQLYAGSSPIPGGDLEIAVHVTGGAGEQIVTPTPETRPEQKPEATQPAENAWWQNIPADLNIVDNPRWVNLENGPEIEVGLLYIEEEEKKDNLPFQISSLNNQSYNVLDENGNLLVKNTAGEIIEIDYDYQLDRYFLNDSGGKRILMSDSYFRLSGDDSTIFKVDSWQNGPFWGENVNDNEFRGKMEVKYNISTNRLWLINQLPLEDYIRSIAEVGDGSHMEFLKSQSVAARTYALFRYLTPKYTNTSDGEAFFTVQSTQADQVYRGYQRELRAPNMVQAAEQTRGIIATYQNDHILAYYFAQSDGKTRDSYSAGMTRAPVDYLIAKSDPPCEGRSLTGHGVGLSQVGGINAANQGANYSQILKYYYTGIELTKMY